jgi:hypothetical protein
MVIMRRSQTIESYGVFPRRDKRMKFHLIGKFKPVNGMSKMIVNGKQKILIDSSMILRRLKMIKWWKRFWAWLLEDDHK